MLGDGLRFLLIRGCGLAAVVTLAMGSVKADGQVLASPVAPCQLSALGSPYIPMDSWMYASLTRLYSLGYLDTAFLGLRPWTRNSVIHMLEETSARLEDAPDGPATDEAQKLYDALWHELNSDASGPCFGHSGQVRVESAYEVGRGISGTPA